jgi:hypothetical protein
MYRESPTLAGSNFMLKCPLRPLLPNWRSHAGAEGAKNGGFSALANGILTHCACNLELKEAKNSIFYFQFCPGAITFGNMSKIR